MIDAYADDAADRIQALSDADDATLAREIRPALLGIAAILRRFHTVDAALFQELEMIAEAKRHYPPQVLEMLGKTERRPVAG